MSNGCSAISGGEGNSKGAVIGGAGKDVIEVIIGGDWGRMGWGNVLVVQHYGILAA